MTARNPIRKNGPLPKVRFTRDIPIVDGGKCDPTEVAEAIDALHNAQALVHKFTPKLGCFVECKAELATVTLPPPDNTAELKDKHPKPFRATILRLTALWAGSLGQADRFAKQMPGFSRVET
jgi:hypothetical protein